MGGAGDARLLGYLLPVKLRVGSRTGSVEAFIPVGVVRTGINTLFSQQRNLIGVDFLQASGARLDFSRAHRGVFSGVEWFPGARAHVTPRESKFLRSIRACR